jgi:hypothetical protein
MFSISQNKILTVRLLMAELHAEDEQAKSSLIAQKKDQ